MKLATLFFSFTTLSIVKSYPTILKYAKRGTLYNTTKIIFKGFSRDQDLTSLNLCHVFPPPKIYETLGSIFMTKNETLKPLYQVRLDKVQEFKRDLFKVHTDAAFLKDVDMPTKSRFYGLNANMQDQIEIIVGAMLEKQRESPKRDMVDEEDGNSLFYRRNGTNKENKIDTDAVRKNDIKINFKKSGDVDYNGLKKRNSVINNIDNLKNGMGDETNKMSDIDKSYLHNLTLLASLFYNSPANLRLTNTNCINDDQSFEDPSLLNYSRKYEPKALTEFTEQSRYLSKKYSLPFRRDIYGHFKTTDVRKEDRKTRSGTINDPSKPKPQNIFEMYFKSTKNIRKSKQLF